MDVVFLPEFRWHLLNASWRILLKFHLRLVLLLV